MATRPSRVVVTGAAGQIGRAVLDLLAAEGIAACALVLHDPGDLKADRVVVGDAQDPSAVAAALTGADAVVHLAALPSPDRAAPDEVFGANSRATFVVLEQAGAAGVRHAAIASSYAILGLTFGTTPLSPPYLPLDVAAPTRISDPYALAKQADEATAAMMARRHGMSVVALRLPYVSDAEGGLADAAHRYATEPARGASEMWSYLDVRDAARAMLLAVQLPSGAGAHVAFVAAPDTLAPFETEWLLDRFHPGVPRRRRFAAREVPLDLTPARDLLGFTAMYPWRADSVPGRRR